MSSRDLWITRHAMLRFCARVAPQFDGRSEKGAQEAREAMREMMDGKPLVWGRPRWKTRQDRMVGFFVDAGDVAFMVIRQRHNGELHVTTVLTPDAPPGVTEGTIPDTMIGAA